MKSGRPLKYDKVLLALEDDALYTPADIADLAMAMGVGLTHPPVDRQLAYTRVRIAMGRFGKNHGFPVDGDGMVKRKGQAPTPAWLGSRWKQKAVRLQVESNSSALPSDRTENGAPGVREPNIWDRRPKRG